MKSTRQLTAIIEREDDTYVALCPELDIASQGGTVEEARKNLVEALELFFASADPTEVARSVPSEVSKVCLLPVDRLWNPQVGRKEDRLGQDRAPYLISQRPLLDVASFAKSLNSSLKLLERGRAVSLAKALPGEVLRKSL